MNDVKSGIIQISGLSALEEAMKQFSDDVVERMLSNALREGAKVIAASAVENAPTAVAPHILRSYAGNIGKFGRAKSGVWIMPGNIKRMIKIKKDKSGSRGYKLTYEIFVKKKDAWYWKFVEFGTSKMAPHEGRGFLRPAFESQKEAAVERIKEFLAASIARRSRK